MIKDSCRKLGTPEPEYTVIGDALRIKFTALENTKITEHTQPNQQNETSVESLEDKILIMLKDNPSITIEELAHKSNFSERSIKRILKRLIDAGIIIRREGKRYGFWKVKK